MDELIRAPIAVGELIDKITILEIKVAHFTDPAKIANARTELSLLRALRDASLPDRAELATLSAELRSVNQEIWNLEDAIRRCEKEQDFGPDFVDTARAIYRTNDRRATVKRRINLAFGSGLVEEKSYEAY